MAVKDAYGKVKIPSLVRNLLIEKGPSSSKTTLGTRIRTYPILFPTYTGLSFFLYKSFDDKKWQSCSTQRFAQCNNYNDPLSWNPVHLRQKVGRFRKNNDVWRHQKTSRALRRRPGENSRGPGGPVQHSCIYAHVANFLMDFKCTLFSLEVP